MSATPSITDFAILQTDVALLKQFNEKVVEPGFRGIQETQTAIQQSLEKLDFVHTKDFEDYKIEVDKRFKDLQRRTWVQNTMSAVAGAVLTWLTITLINNWLNP